MAIYTIVDVRAGYDFPHDASLAHREGKILLMDGFSHAESWGRWSVGEHANIEFLKNLPPKFRCELTLKGYGPNIGKTLLVKIGSRFEHQIVIPDVVTTVAFDYVTSGGGAPRRMDFQIPAPTSPLERGESGDPRKLGIALENIRILPLEGKS